MLNAKPDLNCDPDWQVSYGRMVESASQAVSHILPGQRVFIGTGCAQPRELLRALIARSNELADIEVVHLFTLGGALYGEREQTEHIRVNNLAVVRYCRNTFPEDLGGYTPTCLSDIPRLFSSGQLPLDVALIQVAPPDREGMCSLGISVDITKSAAQYAKLVIAEVNPRMPRTLGDSFIHIDDIDALVPVDAALLEFTWPGHTDATQKIGEYVAALVEDGSTIDLGIGRIQQAVLERLGEKNDLGVHTEMISDAIIDLVEAGVITGACKSVDQGKVVASFALGSRRLYDYVDNNPTFAFRPTEYVSDPRLIAQQHKRVSISAALEVDLTGQVNADLLGTRFYSRMCGELDFKSGMARIPGTKTIVALPSTVQQGKASRIVAQLSAGAGVVVTHDAVNYVVTERGVAYLHGKSLHERALALIGIADPKFASQLLHEAIEAGYVRYAPNRMEEGDVRVALSPPFHRTSMALDDGTRVSFRPIEATDLSRMGELLSALKEETIRYRFIAHTEQLPQKQVRDFFYVDDRSEVAVVGTIETSCGEEIIAIGRYYLDSRTNRAEVAATVRNNWQRRGIGTFLVKHLVTIARRNGIAGFTCEVLPTNTRMQGVIRKSGTKVSRDLRENVYSYRMEFE